jgi:hypothetical protein
MSSGMLKMWISIAAMGLMFLSIILIFFSRFKLKGVLKIITAFFAYIFMIVSGIVIFIILFS